MSAFLVSDSLPAALVLVVLAGMTLWPSARLYVFMSTTIGR